MSFILQLGKSFLTSPGEYLTKLDTSVSLVKFASSIIRTQPLVSRWAFEDKVSLEWLSCPLEIASCCLKTALLVKKIFIQIDKNEPDLAKARNKKNLSALALAALSLLPYTLFAFTKTFPAPAINLLQTTFSNLNIEPTLRGRLTISWEAPAVHKIKQCFSIHQFFLSAALTVFGIKDRSSIEKVWLVGDTVLCGAQVLSLYNTPWIKLKHQLPVPGKSPEKEALCSSKLFLLIRHYYAQAPVNTLISKYSQYDALIQIFSSDKWFTKGIHAAYHTLYKRCQDTIISNITPLMNSLIIKATNIETALQHQLFLPPRILTCLKCVGAVLAPLKLLAKAD